MANWADVIYNITAIYVASFNVVTNTYGTPALVKYGQQLNYEWESDTDEIKAYGQFVAALGIPTKATGTLMMASLNFDAMAIMTGLTPADSGSTPNRQKKVLWLTGGSGTPYFGCIAAYVADDGGNEVIGFPKSKLETYPGFTQEQNQFNVPELTFNAYAPSTTKRMAMKSIAYETLTAPPTDQSGFQAFFAEMLDS